MTMEITPASAAGIAIKTCAVCVRGRIRYEFVNNGYPVCLCEDCGLMFLNPQPTGAWPRQQPAAPRSGTGPVYDARLREYCGFSGGSLLQVRCGGNGVDFSALKNINVTHAELETDSPDTAAFSAAENAFDACLAFDCLQRSRSPEKTLKAIRASLKDGGALLLTAPLLKLSGSSSRRTVEKRDGFAAGNLYFFNEQTVQSLLFKHGFRDIYVAKDCSEDGGAAVLAKKRPLRATPLLSIILPVYNEAATFPQLYAILKAKQLPGVEKEIIIVESNSSDGTREAVKAIASDPGVKAVFEENPRGKGHAVRAGLETASGDFVLIQDGDLEYDINDYDELLEPLLAHRQAFVLGSRHLKGWKMRHFTDQPILSFVMNIGQTFFVFLLNLFCGTKLKDPFTMYKVFRRDCLYGLSLKANRFDFDWEIVIKFIRKGYIPLELPVNYQSRSFGEGKKITWIKDPALWIIALLRFRFCRLYKHADSDD